MKRVINKLYYNQMNVNVVDGKYIVAVSGGVDSMVLLDILSSRPNLTLIAAHFNHGIREDSDEDEKLVVATAVSKGLQVEVGTARLGRGASEGQAREARYKFLCNLQKKHRALAIITAHHQDDLIETALINILRGTKHKGLVSIMRNPSIIRPLLPFTKKEILNYAQTHKIIWREDSTNNDTAYLRNYIRKQITPKLSNSQRNKLLREVNSLSDNLDEQDKIVEDISRKINLAGKINRQEFILLPDNVSKTLMAFWLRAHGAGDFDKKTVERLTIAIKTAKPGTKHDITKGLSLVVGQQHATLG